MKKYFLTILLLQYIFSFSQSSVSRSVDPVIGTGGHGHVFYGANLPFGAVQAGPSNNYKGWDWCSGYNYADSILIGFAQTHLSGTGIGDLGDVLVMPYTGSIASVAQNLQSHYLHATERSRPGYYAVHLEDYNIDAALTATERVAFHQYSFPAHQHAFIQINLTTGNADKAVECFIKELNDSTIIGYRFSRGWARDQKLWFAISSSEKFSSFQIDSAADNKEAVSKNIKANISFAAGTKKVLWKIGISPVSTENALLNIKEEIPHWQFERTVAATEQKWEKELSKITIETFADSIKTIFYTSLYHTMIAPILFNDVNKDYRGTDKKVYNKQTFHNYSVFSLWDTYRSWWQLTTLIHQDKINDFINSLLAINQQQNRLPIWPLMGNETDCMIGYHSVPFIVDAYLKGYRGFDTMYAYNALKQTAMLNREGLSELKANGFISTNVVESVSKGLEYAIDDDCIASMAKALHKEDDYQYYLSRSKFYKNYFDTSIGFMRPKSINGSWKTPFDPFESKHNRGDYTEGNGWQYTWLVPQDVKGLIQLFGSDEKFCKKLDSLFIASGDMGKFASSDISGLIGMYAHGNEPSHHVAYMYVYAGQQWKTAEKVRQVMQQFYTAHPEGLAGNEDCGAMSSWYVMSAMGFYPVSPASGVYVLGSPILKAYTIHLPDQKKFEVTTINNSYTNMYIQSILLNGKPYTRSYIRHSDIVRGGKMVITMGPKPNYNFGKELKDRP